MAPVRVRFAPSPTGHLHLGGARTALFCYLLARQTKGQFILRIEDTDRNRIVPGAEEEIITMLGWLGLDYDEGPGKSGPNDPYRQSERKSIYLEKANELIGARKAYYCFCSAERLQALRQEQQNNKQNPHYDGLCRDISLEDARQRVESGEKHVIRFKTPKDGSTIVHDLVRGEIVVENNMLDDYILVKSDGWALYHLASVVDDYLMNITHVIRGSEWLPTFPIHALIYRAFGWVEPNFVHLSVFLKPSGKGKMSKREAADLKNSGHSIFIKDLGELGYIPEGVINWIALMGWSFNDREEFFSLEDLIHKFNLEHLNPSPAAINFSKLDHFNGLHIRELDADDLAFRVKPFYEKAGLTVDEVKLTKMIPLIRERMITLDDAVEISGFFFMENINPDPKDLLGKKITTKESIFIIQRILPILQGMDPFEKKNLEDQMRGFVEENELDLGSVFGLIRVAVTGQRVSPPLFESMEIIGKDKVILRLENAVSLLRNLN